MTTTTTSTATDWDTPAVELDDMAEPSASELSFIPATEREFEADRMYAAWTRHALDASNTARAAAASRRRSIRAGAESAIGTRAAYATVRELTMVHRRRNAVAIVSDGIVSIVSVEKNEMFIHGNDVDTVTRNEFPLLRVDSVGTVTIWPVRMTDNGMSYRELHNLHIVTSRKVLSMDVSDAKDKSIAWNNKRIETRVETMALDYSPVARIDDAIVSALRAVALVDSFPHCIAPQYAMDRAMDHADKVARSHGSKRVAWDGTAAHMMELLLTHAGGRTRVLADRSRDELRARRAHKTNQAVQKSADDDRMADLIVLLGSAHKTADGVYSALVPDGDTSYALAILDGSELAAYIERPLSSAEKVMLTRKRAVLREDKVTTTRGTNAALAKLGEDIKRRASRAR